MSEQIKQSSSYGGRTLKKKRRSLTADATSLLKARIHRPWQHTEGSLGPDRFRKPTSGCELTDGKRSGGVEHQKSYFDRSEINTTFLFKN